MNIIGYITMTRNIEMIHEFWEDYPGERTVLYYAFSLMRPYENINGLVIRKSLEKLASVEHFDAVIRDFVFFEIMDTEDNCLLRLDNGSFNEVDSLIDRDLGGSDPFELDGLEICTTGVRNRKKIWITEGTDYVVKLFKSTPNLKSSFRDFSQDRLSGRFLTLQTDLNSPFVVFWFANTARMRRIEEIQPLKDYVQAITFNRQLHHVEEAGLRGIGITAAPSYEAHLVNLVQFDSLIPTRLIGPINLAGIGYYIKEHPEHKEKFFETFVRFLDPVEGYFASGIVFSTEVIKFFKHHLEE